MQSLELDADALMPQLVVDITSAVICMAQDSSSPQQHFDRLLQPEGPSQGPGTGPALAPSQRSGSTLTGSQAQHGLAGSGGGGGQKLSGPAAAPMFSADVVVSALRQLPAEQGKEVRTGMSIRSLLLALR